MINYAHRGASEYYPENTLMAFYAGLQMGANGIETDVRITRDGVLVLFHDDSLLRVTGQEGAVSDYTFEELQRFTVRHAVTGREDKIPSLEAFLRCFGWRNLHFAIELKAKHIEKEAAALLDRFNMRSKTVVTSFSFDNLERMRDCAPHYRLGYLYKPEETEAEEKAQRICLEQLCPKAEIMDKAMVDALRAKGYSVRAWGVKDECLMRRVIESGADGMTVNFPDKLYEALKQQRKG
ncbi:MAG: hypothetical protein IKW00_02305 [Clostridia bacterium]|nr:hypothetical protein [Clostridia bacterium]